MCQSTARLSSSMNIEERKAAGHTNLLVAKRIPPCWRHVCDYSDDMGVREEEELSLRWFRLLVVSRQGSFRLALAVVGFVIPLGNYRQAGLEVVGLSQRRGCRDFARTKEQTCQSITAP